MANINNSTMLNPLKTQFDIPKVYEVYANQKNYEILELNQEDDRCFIYFSSNNIYYPNTSEAFEDQVVKGNRFEWKRNIVRSARKVIFIRDIFKTWYLKGINAEINSIEKMLAFLKQETQGLKVICIGNSAGGYAAVLFGCLLQAERVFNFSGQFSLLTCLEQEKGFKNDQPFVAASRNIPQLNQYYSLQHLIAESQVPVFYFYPGGCNVDILQAQELEGLSAVYPFAFNTSTHAKTCYPINFLDLFRRNTSELIALHQKCKRRSLHPFWFSLNASGWYPTMAYILRKLLKKIGMA